MPNQLKVSILVLLDFVLKAWSTTSRMACKNTVSILVLLDFVLKGIGNLYGKDSKMCFNPCFIGFCS